MTDAEERTRISVVMSVHNGEQKLAGTIESILTQTFSDFEFVIVDDGSTDRSREIIEQFAARDGRIKLIAQPNQGLTRALNTACSAAKGAFVARQDCGDRSLPRRLQVQVDYLESHPNVVAADCGCRRVTVLGEFLGEMLRNESPAEVTAALIEDGVGLTHAASMFRRETWQRIGGYREEFRYAQDSDLWLRMTERGFIAAVPEVLFEIEIEASGISALQIDRQMKLWNLARECYRVRQLGESEDELLAEAVKISHSSAPALDAKQKLRQQRRAQYFIGGQLLQQGDAACRKYFLNSLLDRRLFLPSLIKLGRSVFCKSLPGGTQDKKC
jgi:glycosyltransferase involved in cell wall biosynthesis